MPRGTLISIEGVDGAGKTTLAAALHRELAADGARVELLREPGGVEASERIRALVKDPRLALAPRAEALLFAAARAQLLEERVEPLLEDGAIVLLDRFVDSSLAYQGAGRELGVKAIRALNAFATGGLAPDRTLLLRIAPAEGRARRARRAPESETNETNALETQAPEPAAPAPEGERFEHEGEALYARIAAAYEDLVRAEPERVRPIDASQTPEQVLRDALSELADLL
ncbi:MAG TPA: dTMP kinase [Solirubrobacteraceae bacterium]|jgi:dTMP kinase|nr:dTMP kinase [Solirubrobacteraceae bacterium]